MLLFSLIWSWLWFINGDSAPFHVTSLQDLRKMTLNELDMAFAQSSSAPPSVPVGLCTGEILALLPSFLSAINLDISGKATTINKEILTFSNEEYITTFVGNNHPLLLSLVNQVWTGDFVQPLNCSDKRRFIAYHTFARIPLGVAEWSITKISKVLPYTRIKDRDVEGLLMNFNSDLIYDNCNWSSSIKPFLTAQFQSLTLPSYFIDLGRLVGVDRISGDLLLLVKSWLKKFPKRPAIYYVIKIPIPTKIEF